MPSKRIMRFLRFLTAYSIVVGGAVLLAPETPRPREHGQAQPVVRRQPSLPTSSRDTRRGLGYLASQRAVSSTSATTALVA